MENPKRKKEVARESVKLRHITKLRNESFLKYGENFDFGVTLCQWIIDKVGYRGLADAIGHRNIYPRFSPEEDADIREQLRKAIPQYGESWKPLKTVKEIDKELKRK